MNDILFKEVVEARELLKDFVINTPLLYNKNLSSEFNSKIFLKREDLQVVRSYKLRGAYNKINSIDSYQQAKGVICASAGNHAQGVAYSCNLLRINAKIYMPISTPKQKIKQVELFGRENIEIILCGETYDDAYAAAQQDASDNNKVLFT